MKRTLAKTYSEILEVSEKSYYRWKSKDHKKLLSLLEKYFLQSDIEEFLDTGKITKFELLDKVTNQSAVQFDKFLYYLLELSSNTIDYYVQFLKAYSLKYTDNGIMNLPLDFKVFKTDFYTFIYDENIPKEISLELFNLIDYINDNRSIYDYINLELPSNFILLRNNPVYLYENCFIDFIYYHFFNQKPGYGDNPWWPSIEEFKEFEHREQLEFEKNQKEFEQMSKEEQEEYYNRIFEDYYEEHILNNISE